MLFRSPSGFNAGGADVLAALKPLGALLGAGVLPKEGAPPKGEGVGAAVAPKPLKLEPEAPGAPNDGICSDPLLVEAPVKDCG